MLFIWICVLFSFFFKQKTAYYMRISDWSSDVCSSDLRAILLQGTQPPQRNRFMILFPAIDLKDGKCVRLLRGDMGQVTVFNEDPAAQARTFVEKGFEWLHLVDLNGAVEGRPLKGEAVSSLLDARSLQVQRGGGIRDGRPGAWGSGGSVRLESGRGDYK